MSKSVMVFASKYRLLVPISIKDGTYSTSGQKDLVHGDKILSRAFVEDRNKHNNNELYVINEEKSLYIEVMREVNIAKQAEERERASMTTSDLIDAIKAGASVKKPKKKKKEATKEVVAPKVDEVKKTDEVAEAPNESWTVAKLKSHCRVSGIEYEATATKAELLTLINKI